MQIWGLKNCDTCRKAKRALPDATFHDVREQGISDEILTNALEVFGDALVNTKSTTWRGLTDFERSRPALELLKEHPALMKRPLIRTQTGDFYLSWSKDTQTALGV